MRSRIWFHHLITHLLPGMLPCLIGIIFVYSRGHYLLFDSVRTFGGLVIFLLFSLITGYIVQAIGAWFEHLTFYKDGRHPGEAYFRRESLVMLSGEQELLISKYIHRFDKDLSPEVRADPAKREECFNDCRWAIKEGRREEYIMVLDTYYDLYKGLYAAFMICGLIAIFKLLLFPSPFNNAMFLKVFGVILLGSAFSMYVSYRRTKDYLEVYSRER